VPKVLFLNAFDPKNLFVTHLNYLSLIFTLSKNVCLTCFLMCGELLDAIKIFSTWWPQMQALHVASFLEIIK
jgi:hypothetical protein